MLLGLPAQGNREVVEYRLIQWRRRKEGSMKPKGANGVGRFAVEFEVANHIDVINAEQGLLPSEKVRRLTIKGTVDAGSTKMVLPEKIVRQLGLPITGKVKVTYASRETATRDAVKDVHVKLLGREGVFSASVEPKRRTALIGAIILEDLDFLVDCTHQRLVPRDPRMITAEIE
jgi:predicted aspartyl protease